MIPNEALASSIIRTLKQYGDAPLLVDFVAKVIGRRRWEIQDSVDKLTCEQILEYVASESGDTIKLLKK